MMLLVATVRKTRRHHVFKSSSRYSNRLLTSVNQISQNSQYIILTGISFSGYPTVQEWWLSTYSVKITLLRVLSNPSPVFSPSFLLSLNWTTNGHALPFDFGLVIVRFSPEIVIIFPCFSFMSSQRLNTQKRRRRRKRVWKLGRVKNFSLIMTTLFRWVLYFNGSMYLQRTASRDGLTTRCTLRLIERRR